MFLAAKSEQDIRQRLLKKQNDIENEIAVYMAANTLVQNDSSRPRGLSRSKSTQINGRPGIDFKMDEEEEEDKVAAEVIKKPSYPLEDEEDEKEQQEQAEVSNLSLRSSSCTVMSNVRNAD
ncbi:hypothetical protein N0V85_000739 [Neurospora sp. IMI 360204]|nr:hypothetical protein N0V85_000739 [Neurospora sp. IMI 360204]